jgi:hypothetical protein
MRGDRLNIHDLYVREIAFDRDQGRQALSVLTDQDSLLRRLGLVEVVRLEPSSPAKAHLRAVADEVWALIGGKVTFEWKDLRADSPTAGAEDQVECDQPTLVLAPFGVAFSVFAREGDALLLRLATHRDGVHPGDQSLEMERSS